MTPLRDSLPEQAVHSVSKPSRDRARSGFERPANLRFPILGIGMIGGVTQVGFPRRANRAVVDLLASIAAAKRATAAQVALAWLLAQKPWIVPIPGTTKLHRLDENLGGAELRLTADDIRDISAAFAGIEVAGARYPPEFQKLVGR